MRIVEGVVKQVVSGDTVIVVTPGEHGQWNDHRVRVAHIQAPKRAENPTDADEAGAREAQEFTRALVIGKPVTLHLSDNGLTGTVLLKNDSGKPQENLAVALLKAGLAKTVQRPRPAFGTPAVGGPGSPSSTQQSVGLDGLQVPAAAPRADGSPVSNVPTELLEAEESAKEAHRGIFAEPGTPDALQPLKLNRYLPLSSPDADSWIEELKEGISSPSLEGVVDRIFSVSSSETEKDLAIEVYFPKERIVCEGVLTGVRVSDEGEKKAIEFLEARILSRKLNIRIDGLTGSPQSLLLTPIHPRGNMIDLILSQGLVYYSEKNSETLNATDRSLLQTKAKYKSLDEFKKATRTLPTATARAPSAAPAAASGTASSAASSLAPTGAPGLAPRAAPTTTGAQTGSGAQAGAQGASAPGTAGGAPQPPVAAPAPVRIEYKARLVDTISGGCIMIIPCEGEIGDLSTAAKEVRTVYLSSVRTPRYGSRNKVAEPWGLEAVQLVRSLCFGKLLSVTQDYTRPSPPGAGQLPVSDEFGNLHHVTISVEAQTATGEIRKKIVNVELVLQGFGRLVPSHPSNHNKSVAYDIVAQAEELAIQARRGVHSETAPKYLINDLVGPPNAKRAKLTEPSLKREGHIPCFVEQITSGSRYRLVCSTHNAYMSLALSGVRSPMPARRDLSMGTITQDAEPFADESVLWAKLNVLYRRCTVAVSTCDRNGTFIGVLYLEGGSGPQQRGGAHPSGITKKLGTPVQVAIVRAGYGYVDFANAERLAFYNDLCAAQDEAMQAKRGMWALESNRRRYGGEGGGEGADGETMDSMGSGMAGMRTAATTPAGTPLGMGTQAPKVLSNVVVSHVNSANSFCIQLPDASISFIQDTCNDAAINKLTMTTNFRRGDIIIAPFTDGQHYRARVTSVEQKERMLKVEYVDYGNTGRVAIPEEGFPVCPPELQLEAIPAAAMHVSLAMCREVPDLAAQVQETFEDTIGNDDSAEFDCTLVGPPDAKTGARPVVLYPSKGSPLELAYKVADHGLISLNEAVLRKGSVRLTAATRKAKNLAEAQRILPGLSETVFNGARAAAREARGKREDIWFYGDMGDSEDEDEQKNVPRRGAWRAAAAR